MPTGTARTITILTAATHREAWFVTVPPAVARHSRRVNDVHMLELLARRWWLITLRGALAVVFGLLAIMWPAITVLALVLLWGAYALIDGITAVGLAGASSGPRRTIAHVRATMGG
jgi:hypothetical protein